MKINFILFAMTVLFGVSCSTHMEKRDPASVSHEKETSHEKFQGTFDKQY
jgi:hypothetical protein